MHNICSVRTLTYFLLLLLLPSAIYGSTSPEAQFILPTSIAQHPRLVHLNDPAAHVYRLTSKGLLQGRDRSSHLSNLATTTSTIAVAPSLRAFSNGVEVPALSPVTVHSSAGLSFAEHDGAIVSIWGQGLHLTPLDHTAHPGIFLNTNRVIHMDDQNNIPIKLTQPHLDHSVNSLPTTSRRTTCRSGRIHFFELAVAFDNTFCKQFGNSFGRAATAIQIAIEQSSAPFEKASCVKLALVHLDGHCADANDPYIPLMKGTTTTVRPLFAQIWQSAPFTSVRRDGVLLISDLDGFRGSQYCSRAHVGSACSKVNGFGWVWGPVPRFTAHEIGHMLGAWHDTSGTSVMTTTFDTSIPLVLSANSTNIITSFIDNDPRSSCITTDAPRCDDTCPAGCRNGRCAPPPSASPRPPANRICAANYKPGRVPKCQERRLLAEAWFPGIRRLRTSFEIRNGAIFMILYASHGQILSAGVSVTLGTRPSMPALGTPFTPGKSWCRFKADNVDELIAPKNGRSCCGAGLKLRVRVRICPKSALGAGNETCTTTDQTLFARLWCVDPCRGGAGRRLKMNSGRRCPMCQR